MLHPLPRRLKLSSPAITLWAGRATSSRCLAWNHSRSSSASVTLKRKGLHCLVERRTISCMRSVSGVTATVIFLYPTWARMIAATAWLLAHTLTSKKTSVYFRSFRTSSSNLLPAIIIGTKVKMAVIFQRAAQSKISCEWTATLVDVTLSCQNQCSCRRGSLSRAHGAVMTLLNPRSALFLHRSNTTLHSRFISNTNNCSKSHNILMKSYHPNILVRPQRNDQDITSCCQLCADSS